MNGKKEETKKVKPPGEYDFPLLNLEKTLEDAEAQQGANCIELGQLNKQVDLKKQNIAEVDAIIKSLEKAIAKLKEKA